VAKGPIEHHIEFTETAQEMLFAIRDARVRQKIADAVDELKDEPLKRSHPLQDNLAGLYSKRAVGQRYRIIFSIDDARSPPALSSGRSAFARMETRRTFIRRPPK